MIIGINSYVPQFYWINLGKPENLFLNVFNFQGPKQKLPETLRVPVFPRNKTLERRKCNRGATRAEHGPRDQIPWSRGASSFPPRCSDAVNLRLDGFVLTENWLYKGCPCESQKGAPLKHRNTKQEPGRLKIGGENSGGTLPVWSPSPLTTLPSSPWWRGSSPPLNYRFVAVANCISLSCSSSF
jgi:hypothetical protein